MWHCTHCISIKTHLAAPALGLAIQVVTPALASVGISAVLAELGCMLREKDTCYAQERILFTARVVSARLGFGRLPFLLLFLLLLANSCPQCHCLFPAL